MNNSKGAIVILSSIVISSVLTYLLTKSYYEKRFTPKPEIVDKPKEAEKEEQKKEEKPQEKKDEVTKYADKYKQQHESLIREYSADPTLPKKKIEIIDGDIYGSDKENFEEVEYTLFRNNILVDEEYERITDPDNSIGRYAYERFDELAHNDIVYVRNHEFNLDIAIVRDPRSYEEYLGERANAKS